MDETSTRITIQLFSMVLSAVAIGIWVRWMNVFKESRAWAIGPIWYLFQVVVYYWIVAVYNPLSPGSAQYTLWSAILRLEAVVLLTASPCIMLYFRAKRKWTNSPGKPSSSP